MVDYLDAPREPAPEDRFWITDPAGHRQHENERTDHLVGETIQTVFGDAVVMAGPTLPPDEWICDLCNDRILTRWGDEPWPVPMVGGYALCIDHYHQLQEQPETDRFGEPIRGSRLGPWPQIACNCDPCQTQIRAWGLMTLKPTLN